MHTYSKTFLALISTLLVLIVAGCGNSEPNTSEEGESTYTVEHAMGKAELKKEPVRVVALTNESMEALLSLGIKPVGAVQSTSGDPYYDHIKEDLKDVPVVGTELEVNVEKVMALKPDLIVGSKIRHEAIYNKLNLIAPTVFSETLRGEWKENFQLYAKAVHKEAKGKEVLDQYEKRINELKVKLGDRTKQTVSVVRFMPGSVRIYYTDSFTGVIFEQLGFQRPEHQAKLFKNPGKLGNFAVEVDKELIPEMDGDLVFYFTYEPKGKETGVKLEKEYLEDPLWKNLNAAKKGNVYKVDDVIWNTAGGVIAANQMLDELETILLKSR